MNKTDKLLADGESLTIPRSQSQRLVSFVTFEANEYLVLLPDGVLTSKRLGVLSTLIQPCQIIHSYKVMIHPVSTLHCTTMRGRII